MEQHVLIKFFPTWRHAVGVAILILQIADTTVALLHNLDASLCAIKVMQHGLHKGTG